MTASRIFRLFLALALLIAIIGCALWTRDWMAVHSPIPASGGLYFPGERIIEVPQFFQNDDRWGRDPLGPTDSTLGAEGCAVASAAMVLAGYGADLDPGRLNAFVQSIDGYTPQGWLYWEAAAEYPPGLARHVYEDDPSHYLIDRNLLVGNPVIVRVRYPSGTTHFVVIVGKRGYDYLIRDPGAGGTRGVYPLKDFGRPIEALRFYEKLPNSDPVGQISYQTTEKN